MTHQDLVDRVKAIAWKADVASPPGQLLTVACKMEITFAVNLEEIRERGMIDLWKLLESRAMTAAISKLIPREPNAQKAAS